MLGTRIAAAALAFVAYYAAGLLGLSLTFVNASVSPVWPPTGVAIAALALLGLRYWPIVLVGAFLFNLATTPWAPSLVIAMGNTLEGALGAAVLVRLGLQKAFTEAPRTFAYAVGGGVLAPAISATMGAATLWGAGLATLTALPDIWLTWWLGDVGGALILAPAIVLWFRPVDTMGQHGWMAVAASVLVTSIAFWAPDASALWMVMVMAPPVWAVLAGGPRATATVMVTTAGAAVVGTIRGRGPFYAGDENEALLLIQIFVAMLSVACLSLAAGRHAMRDLDDQDARQRRATRAVRWLPVILALLPLTLGAAIAGGPLQDLRSDTFDERRSAHAGQVLSAWEGAFALQEAYVDGLAAHFEATNVTREEFHRYVDSSGWFEHDVAPVAVSFNRAIDSEDVPAFEQARQQVFGPDFVVHPDTGAPVRYVVDYIQPLEGNEPALGLDIGFNASRLITIQRAIATGDVEASEALQLVQGTFGILMMKATYDEGQVTGLAVAVLGIDEMREAIIADLGRDGIDGAATVYPEGLGGPQVGPSLDAYTARTLSTPGGRWLFHIADGPGLLTITESGAPSVTIASGGLLAISFAGIVYAYDSTRRRAYSIAADVMARTREADQARAQAKQLAEMDRLKTEFINMGAHELRTPLVPLRAQLAILKHRLGADDKSVAVMQRSLDRLGGLVEDLLSAARAQAGRIEVDLEDGDPHLVVHGVVEEYLAAAKEAGLRLTLQTIGHGTIPLDPPRLSQVVSNIIGNAIKFTPHGGHIEVTSRLDDGWTLDVQDNGTGIAPDQLEHLFEPFMQAHGPDGPKGSGLGLYVCQAIVEAHGGKVSAFSEGPGMGSRFTVQIRP